VGTTVPTPTEARGLRSRFAGVAYVARRLAMGGAMAASLTVLVAPTAAAKSGSGHRASASHQVARARALRVLREDHAFRLGGRRSTRKRHATARAAVVGGALDRIEEVPWQVAVFAEFEFEGEEFGLLCGGALIDLTHVVTAGHCTYNPATGAPLPASALVVVAGASKITPEEIRYGASVQVQLISSVRRHPGYDYAEGAGTPDDVAVLALKFSLSGSSAVEPIALPAAQLFPPEGIDASLSGYGAENSSATELNESLYSLGVDLEPSSTCGGDADAVLLCGRSNGGTACSGDSGSGVTLDVDGTATLIGLVDFGVGAPGEPCPLDSLNGFVNVSAPEIRDFIIGSESPPLAPRGEGAVLTGEPTVGKVLTCTPRRWRPGPVFTYEFIDTRTGQMLQQGSSATYKPGESDLGRTIYCRLIATNAGGMATGLSSVAPAVSAAPPAPEPTPPTPSLVPEAPVGRQSPRASSGSSLEETGGLGTSSTGSAGGVHQSVLASALRSASVRGSIAFVNLRCNDTEGCEGRLKLVARTTARASARHNALADGGRSLVIGRTSFVMAQPGEATVEVPLTALGRRLLRRSGRAGLRATLMGADVASRTVVLRRG